MSFLLFALLSVLDPEASKTSMFSEKIEARVGNEIITTSDLRSVVESLRLMHKDAKEEALYSRARELLIDQSLMSQYLNKMQMAVTDRDVDQRIQSIISSNKIAGISQFREVLAAQGTSYEKFRQQLKRQMEQMQFLGLIKRSAIQTIEEKDLLSYYNTHKNAFDSSHEYELAECVIPIDSDPSGAERIALDVERNPKTFDACVKNHSQSPTASQKGYLGKFQKKMLREDIEQRVFSLKKGEVAVIRQPTTIQILKILDIKNLGPRSFQNSKQEIRELIEAELLEKEMRRVLSELRSTTFIRI